MEGACRDLALLPFDAASKLDRLNKIRVLRVIRGSTPFFRGPSCLRRFACPESTARRDRRCVYVVIYALRKNRNPNTIPHSPVVYRLASSVNPTCGPGMLSTRVYTAGLVCCRGGGKVRSVK